MCTAWSDDALPLYSSTFSLTWSSVYSNVPPDVVILGLALVGEGVGGVGDPVDDDAGGGLDPVLGDGLVLDLDLERVGARLADQRRRDLTGADGRQRDLVLELVDLEALDLALLDELGRHGLAEGVVPELVVLLLGAEGVLADQPAALHLDALAVGVLHEAAAAVDRLPGVRVEGVALRAAGADVVELVAVGRGGGPHDDAVTGVLGGLDVARRLVGHLHVGGHLLERGQVQDRRALGLEPGHAVLVHRSDGERRIGVEPRATAPSRRETHPVPRGSDPVDDASEISSLLARSARTRRDTSSVWRWPPRTQRHSA